MRIISDSSIRQYLNGFVPDNHKELRLLLELCLLNAVKNEPKLLKQVTHQAQLSGKKIQREFNRRAFKDGHSTWYLFSPPEDLAPAIDKIVSWLSAETGNLRHHYSGTVRRIVRNKVKTVETLDEALALTQTKLLEPEELEAALSTRAISDEENKEYTKHITDLENRHYAVQILTERGMINAGRKASNCLGSMAYPYRATTPHRLRVLEPDKWLYFSIRDADNNSVCTITVDIRNNQLGLFHNGTDDFDNRVTAHNLPWNFIEPSLLAIAEKYPIITHFSQFQNLFSAEDDCYRPNI